jgi:hypothetical protein
MEGGTNFCKGGQTLTEIRPKMTEILRRGQTLAKLLGGKNFGKGGNLQHRGQTLALRRNFCTKYLILEETNFGKNQIKNG